MAVENLHIAKIKVENYKSLRNSEIEFKEGLNIIIGKNGAGKSNLLEFIDKYVVVSPIRVVRSLRPSINFFVAFGYVKNKVRNLFSYFIERIKPAKSSNASYIFELTINKLDGHERTIIDEKLIFNDLVTRDEIFKKNKHLSDEFDMIRDTEKGLISFSFPEELLWLSKPTAMTIETDIEKFFTPNVNYSESQLFFKLEYEMEDDFFEEIIKLNLEDIKQKLIIYVSEFFNNIGLQTILDQYTIIKKIRLNPNINIYRAESRIIIENLYIDFYINNDWLPWSFLSDGTKRLFYLISECISRDRGVLLIEEPELGIHPHQLYKLLEFLKEQAKEKQIIISTHSPLVLDALNEKELNRIIIAEYSNGTKFRHLSKAEISKAKAYIKEVGDLSTYWLHSDLEK